MICPKHQKRRRNEFGACGSDVRVVFGVGVLSRELNNAVGILGRYKRVGWNDGDIVRGVSKIVTALVETFLRRYKTLDTRSLTSRLLKRSMQLTEGNIYISH